MKTSLLTPIRRAPLALVALLAVLVLPVSGTGVIATGAPAAADASLATAAPSASCAAVDGLPIASARPVCDDAQCNQDCIDQGGGFGFCRGNLCVCGF